MFVYVGKNFTATLTGSVLREIRCEKCDAEYGYQLSRTASGTASAPYYIAQGAAQRRAQRTAAKRLEKLLQHDEELVACPSCGHVQMRAVLAARRRAYKTLKSLAITVIALGAAGAVISWIISVTEPSSREHTIPFAWWMAGASSCGVALLWLRRTLANRLDPNTLPAGTWSPPPGTPPAIIPGQGDVEPAGAPQVPMADFAAGGTLAYASHPRCIVQIGRFTFPTCCSLCLEEDAPHTYKLPFSVRGDEVPLPLCGSCYSAVRRRSWKYMLLGACAGAVVAIPIWLVPWARDEGARVALAIVAALFIGVIGAAVLPARRLRLCQVRTLDAQRGVLELWFTNPEYGRRLMDDYRRSEAAASMQAQSILQIPPPPPARVG